MARCAGGVKRCLMPNLLCVLAASREPLFKSREDAKARRDMVCTDALTPCHAELVSASIVQPRADGNEAKWTLNQVQGDGLGFGG